MQKFKELFSDGMPEENHKKNKQKSHIPFRLNLLFFIVFTLFVALIIQLGYLQIINGDSLQEKIEASSVRKVETSTPRGMIYDSAGNALVQNHANPAIIYTRGLNVTADELLSVAQKLVQLIEIETDEKLTERDLKDTWLADKDNLEAARKRLPKKEVENEYQALVDSVTPQEIAFDEEQLKVATIFKKLNSAQELTTVFVKNKNVTNEELAIVSEHSKEIAGISTGTDWSREVLAENDSIRSVIGKVSTEQQGLPAELMEEYLAKGYALNDRVGTSFLEKQYEEILQGTKSHREITINHEGEIQNQKEIFAGEKGDNLVLTMHSEFQSKVDGILKNEYQKLVDNDFATFSPGAYVVVLDTKTGGVLAMSGYYHEIHSKELQEDTIGVYKKSFVPGSVVKAGTLTAGWQSGVLSGNEVVYDQPIYLEGANPKASIFNRTGSNNQNLSARQALEVSSNSYMIQIALRLLGIQYHGNKISVPSLPNQAKAYEQLRSAMAQYGMGTKTGIDLPDEETGIQTPVKYLSGANNDGGKILDLSFGQFDTYTPLQLAQYVATIANDGVRLQPHLVEGIYGNSQDGGLGKVKQVIEPKVLNEVDLSGEELAIIQQGFRDVVTGTHPYTTGTRLRNSKMEIAAKTGTAEVDVYEDGKKYEVENSNVVAYGPASAPEVAVAVVMPQLNGLNRGPAHLEVTRQIMDTYYEMFMNN